MSTTLDHVKKPHHPCDQKTGHDDEERTMTDDKYIAEIRKIRDEMAAAYGYDVEKMLADIKQHQDKTGRKLVSLSRPAKTKPRVKK
jgi:hypothetical protein